MNEFKKNYINFLKKQAQDEIDYLQRKGHQGLIDEPCIFCIQAVRQPGNWGTNGDFINKFTCNRVQILQSFISELNIKSSSFFKNNYRRYSFSSPQHSSRRTIGEEVSRFDALEESADENNSIPLLPPVHLNLKF